MIATVINRMKQPRKFTCGLLSKVTFKKKLQLIGMLNECE